MLCGNCKEHHETVAEVRACHGQAADTGRGQQHGRGGHAAHPWDPPTDAQWNHFRDLASRLKRPVPDKDRNLYTIKSIKPLIQVMKDDVARLQKENPDRLSVGKLLPDVPEGRYAIPSLTGNNDLDFFKVDRPDEGKWKGYIFVKRVIGGRPADVSIRNGGQRRLILDAIHGYGIDKARTLFGTELGQCWKCGRTLTDEASRAAGIGPDCAAQV
jgi:hypothetical protein